MPNTFINGKHLGGCDATMGALESGELFRRIDSAKTDQDKTQIGKIVVDKKVKKEEAATKTTDTTENPVEKPIAIDFKPQIN